MTSLIFNPPVIAHRGASGYAPENTMAAFFKAAQLGIKWVEFDVMQAACGTPVIFHDDALDRTTNGRGELIDYSFSYLQQLDAGSWFHPVFAGERILSFVELLTFLSENKINANVEIKSLPGQEKVLVKKVLQILQDFSGPLPTILFSSFSIAALYYLREFSDQALLGLLLHEWEADWEASCEELNCVSLHINEEILSGETALKIKKMNKILLSYTVNNPKRAQVLFDWGVDAVFSDVPDVILSQTLRR